MGKLDDVQKKIIITYIALICSGLVLCIIGTALGAVFMIFAIVGTKAISYEELMRQIKKN